MDSPDLLPDKTLLENALRWFHPELRARLLDPLERQFPSFPLPRDVQAALRITASLVAEIQALPGAGSSDAQLGEQLTQGDPSRLPFLKQIVLLYRRHRAAATERFTEMTFHLELTSTLEREINALDALVAQDWFQQITSMRLPRLRDYLPVQVIEATAQAEPLSRRQYDQKFHILQAPSLFLPDLAYFRARCEDREAPLAVAFLDIDNFKRFNTAYTEPKVDRNLLPRFLQTVEAHVYHHGHGYQEGGDEIVLLVPSLSRPLALAFLDELRRRLAGLEYQDIPDKTTVSIGVCIAEPDCPLTDRELRDRASLAKKFAKDQGKDRIATYSGSRFTPQELVVADSPAP